MKLSEGRRNKLQRWKSFDVCRNFLSLSEEFRPINRKQKSTQNVILGLLLILITPIYNLMSLIYNMTKEFFVLGWVLPQAVSLSVHQTKLPKFIRVVVGRVIRVPIQIAVLYLYFRLWLITFRLLAAPENPVIYFYGPVVAVLLILSAIYSIPVFKLHANTLVWRVLSAPAIIFAAVSVPFLVLIYPGLLVVLVPIYLVVYVGLVVQEFLKGSSVIKKYSMGQPFSIPTSYRPPMTYSPSTHNPPAPWRPSPTYGVSGSYNESPVRSSPTATVTPPKQTSPSPYLSNSSRTIFTPPKIFTIYWGEMLNDDDYEFKDRPFVVIKNDLVRKKSLYLYFTSREERENQSKYEEFEVVGASKRNFLNKRDVKEIRWDEMRPPGGLSLNQSGIERIEQIAKEILLPTAPELFSIYSRESQNGRDQNSKNRHFVVISNNFDRKTSLCLHLSSKEERDNRSKYEEFEVIGALKKKFLNLRDVKEFRWRELSSSGELIFGPAEKSRVTNIAKDILTRESEKREFQ